MTLISESHFKEKDKFILKERRCQNVTHWNQSRLEISHKDKILCINLKLKKWHFRLDFFFTL